MKIGVIVPECGEPTLDVCLSFIGAQRRQPDHVVIVDGRLDGTKAGAQNWAWDHYEVIRGMDVIVTVDADTILDVDYLREIEKAFMDPRVAAASGCVLSWATDTWARRGRAVEYLAGFHVPRVVQRWMGVSLVASGCCSAWRTEFLNTRWGSWGRRDSPWPTRTLGEDMDLTWQAQAEGRKVVYVPGALCATLDPDSPSALLDQLRRWSTGFLQNLRLHGLRLRPMHGLWIVLGLAWAYLLPWWVLYSLWRWPAHALLGYAAWVIIPSGIGAWRRSVPWRDWLSWLPGAPLSAALTFLAAYWALVSPSRRWGGQDRPPREEPNLGSLVRAEHHARGRLLEEGGKAWESLREGGLSR